MPKTDYGKDVLKESDYIVHQFDYWLKLAIEFYLSPDVPANEKKYNLSRLQRKFRELWKYVRESAANVQPKSKRDEVRMYTIHRVLETLRKKINRKNARNMLILAEYFFPKEVIDQNVLSRLKKSPTAWNVFALWVRTLSGSFLRNKKDKEAVLRRVSEWGAEEQLKRKQAQLQLLKAKRQNVSEQPSTSDVKSPSRRRSSSSKKDDVQIKASVVGGVPPIRQITLKKEQSLPSPRRSSSGQKFQFYSW